MKKFSKLLLLLAMLVLVGCESEEWAKFEPFKIESCNIELTKDKKDEFKVYGQIPSSGETVEYNFTHKDADLTCWTDVYSVKIDNEQNPRNVVREVALDYAEDQFVVFDQEGCKIVQCRAFPYTIKVSIDKNSSDTKRTYAIHNETAYSKLEIILSQEAE